jgi:RNA polymerase sigma-70 factor (ECF subfamily)
VDFIMGFVLPDFATEDRLLSQANLGDQTAITEIYERYFPAMYQFIRLQVDDSGLAEDIASEVFFKFVDAVGGRSSPRLSLRGWLFRVARNEIYRHYGKIRQFSTSALDDWLSIPSEGDLEVQFIHSVDLERARQALRMLAADQQEVLILRFVEELDLQEVAEIMGRNVGAIKSLQFRAISTLRQILGESNVKTYG